MISPNHSKYLDLIYSASPFKATVYNNQIQFTLTYKINITEGTIPKTHTFSATTYIQNVSVSYVKEFKLDTGVFAIDNVTVKYDVNSIISTFSPDPTSKERQSFEDAIKGSSHSLYSVFAKLFSNDIVKQNMQSNTKGEHLSRIYSENPYNYKFYETTIPIDITTLGFQTV